jgi:hypothetical protein
MRTFVDDKLVNLLLVVEIGRLLLKRDNWSTELTHTFACLGGVNWLTKCTHQLHTNLSTIQ